MTALKTLTMLACLSLLSACSFLSPYSSVTKLDLHLNASDQLNPDVNGRPSPMVVRLIELKLPVTFQKGDFFSLYEQPKQVLSPDLIGMEEIDLRPGTEQHLKLRLAPETRYLGVLAAYRDLPDTQWRYLISVTPERITTVNLTLDDSGIRNAADTKGAERDRT